MLLLLGAFFAGILTVLAPCVLALLPVIIGGSVSGAAADKKRPLIIAISLAISIILFTLLLKATTLLINVPPQFITYFSGGVIVALGIITLFPKLYAKVIAKLGIEHRANSLLGAGFKNKSHIIGPIIIGAALGPVFSSCSPVYAYILATILPVNFAQAFAYIIAYVLGLSLILLLIGYLGQRFVSKIKFASNPDGLFQRIIAVLFIIIGVLIITGYDKKLQTYVSTKTPFNFDALSAKLIPAGGAEINDNAIFNVEPYEAPEFVGLENWINSNPQTLEQLKGKVVMVDFWTYSCINCIRNNPYIEEWHKAYEDDGLVVIGVHAPEFAFEKVPANVEKAVKDQKLTYPVALDNDFETWGAFENQYWPASYLIDKDGKVRRVHYGEGEYRESEEAIRQLLMERGSNLSRTPFTNKTSMVPTSAKETPETYLGSQRASNYNGTPALGAASTSTFAKPAELKLNQWALSGTWDVTTEKIIARSDSTLTFRAGSKDMYLVAGSSTPKKIGVKLNGQQVADGQGAGSDVTGSSIEVGESKLYRVIDNGMFNSDYTVELTVPEGVELNVFTFGS